MGKAVKKPKKPAKPRHTSGRHATPRRPVMFPTAWDAVVTRLAGDSGAPKVHYLMGLIAREAAQRGVPHPEVPVLKTPLAPHQVA